ncbi:hypothetical protein AYL99_11971 [Fonsecaea erecta]|uniref:Uncharacterized protein n=1 Tax=Fonsecaea erecta TaxID=1367422 RepID=A0A178Z221_9EURO|nr:hypothetical protein AYL99_11971 [Fonsecaea erecta]OAP53848.1 hypothetical protein AYL99_11971 [Fonsecaea erecta]
MSQEDIHSLSIDSHQTAHSFDELSTGKLSYAIASSKATGGLGHFLLMAMIAPQALSTTAQKQEQMHGGSALRAVLTLCGASRRDASFHPNIHEISLSSIRTVSKADYDAGTTEKPDSQVRARHSGRATIMKR